ncbi:protease inhibitor I42 family protein [Streptomyces sp. NPDC048521]|uniref:protease inhibitor I42 family protein n=1 Tax=Streptomyces sp. NPDC048521 TaxID=3365566 RepID=UPI00370FACED
MTSRAPLLGPAALACLLALTGCGAESGTGTPGVTATSGGTATSRGTATPGGTAGAEYGTGSRDITVEPGKRFSLTVPAAPTLGQDWYLTDPKPDTAVLEYRGKRKNNDGSDADGSTGGTQSFDFTALAKGKATVRLLYCPLYTCTGPGPGDRSTLSPTPDGTASPSPYPTATGTPDAHAAFYVFTITVR